MSKLPNYFFNWLISSFIISLLFFIGTSFTFAQVYPTPTPAEYCGDGTCQTWIGENEDNCPEDCGPPAPPGTGKCSKGYCADGTPYWTYCSPDCTTVPRTCYDNPSCAWPPPNCAEGGCPPGTCPTVAHCGVVSRAGFHTCPIKVAYGLLTTPQA